ncbi:MAG: ABC transporter permease [Lachnospiraceae bacterium]|jgi:peptide/nickel transport system permease protein|nr:ABC transporter permease [Lachnospiraceae bacterium]
MGKYIAKRLGQAVVVLLIVTAIIFLLVNVAGDPTANMLPLDASEADRQAMREAMGLNRPLFIQYMDFLGKAIRGDFGNSYRYNLPAINLALQRMPVSLQLAGTALLFAVLFAIPLGILSAKFANSPFDLVVSSVSVLGRAMPNFWIGILLILLFAVNWKLFPVSGSGTAKHLVLPAMTLAIQSASQIIPLIRSNMLDVMQEDYIRTARSKGVGEGVITMVHAFKNALVPVVTVVALEIPGLIGGALITETIFAWPGLGQFLIQAINNRDMSVVQVCIFMISVITLFANLVADLVYCLIDPRIRY